MMGLTVTEKIIRAHLVSGTMEPGQEISIKIDQTLTQDSTGTMAYLQLEAMGVKQVKTERSVAYIDHNMLQAGFENADDHKYIQTVAAKHGVYFSKPGNGVCHQVHLERFSAPGKTLLGSDSHTPTGGAVGMLAIGAGGLDVAVAMGGGAYSIVMPEIVNVRLIGKLRPFVSAKDIILEVLRRFGVKGGVGRVMEYTGDGILGLSVPERATITNMGAELGATSSLFPSDAVTKAFLEAQGRGEVFREIGPDLDAAYVQTIEIDLSQLVPLCAAPHSPDNVLPVSETGGIKVDQVAIGSCTNGSYQDFMRAAAILKGKSVHPDVSLVLAPGSKQVLTMLAEAGALTDLVAAGARLLEAGCGPCIGMGQAPATGAVSLRTFNRNFYGRSGTASAEVYLVSPETAAASAITGVFTDPETLDVDLRIPEPTAFAVSDNLIIPPTERPDEVEVVRGPNIKPFPLGTALQGSITEPVLIKVEDNITTDHIMLSNAALLPYRSNIPHLADFCLVPCDPDFPARAKEHCGGCIVAGENYGQGSSREHAALAPLYLGVRFVLAKSFARIHKANLINSGIIPLTFVNPADYDRLGPLEKLTISDVPAQLKSGEPVIIQAENGAIQANLDVSPKELEMLLCGGKINWIRRSMQR